MDIKKINQAALTALNQIKSTIGDAPMMSWGIHDISAKEFNGMPALVLTVDARLFKGDVIVALNEGMDVYEVWLSNDEGEILLGAYVYCDEVGKLIDTEIEVGDDWDAYMAFCEQERQKVIKEQGFDPRGKNVIIF